MALTKIPASLLDTTAGLTVAGDLTVSGTTTTVNSTTLEVADKNITLNYHASNDTSSNADGAGITIQDAVDGSNNATLNWSASNDRFVMSHGLQVTSGNVGIGTTNPLAPLTISNGGGPGFEFGPGVTNFSVANTNYIASYDRSASTYRDISFDLGGTAATAIRFQSGGKVGIGTASPSKALDISNTTSAKIHLQGGTNQNGISFAAAGNDGVSSSAYYLGVGSDLMSGTDKGAVLLDVTNNRSVLFDDQSTSRLGFYNNSMVINSSGNVGIGLTNQANKLQVDGDICIGKATTGADLKSTLKMRGSNGSSQLQVFDLVNDGENGRVDFQYNRAGSSAQTIMTFGATVGNVGIGTTSPVKELQIGSATAGVDANMFLAAGTNAYSRLYMGDATTGTGLYAGLLMYDHNNDDMTMYTSSTERMRINSTGRVMIGTTTEGRAGEGADMFTIGDTSNNSGMTMRSGTSGYGSIYFSDATSGTGEYAGYLQYSHANERLHIATGSSIRLNVDSDGLKFNNDTAAANGLNDYEEGTWTPVMHSSGGAVSASYSYRSAYYIKIGNSVFVRWGFRLSSRSGGSGAAEVTGLPFTSKNYGGYQQPAAFVNAQGLTSDPDGPVLFYLVDSNTKIQGRLMNNADTQLPISYFQNGSWCIGQFTYDVS